MVPTDERLIPLNEAIHNYLNGATNESTDRRRISYPTVHRWAAKGCRGHVLETWLVGGRRYTSKEAVHRFLAALNSGGRSPAGGGFSNPDRREHERVERELDALGL